MARETSPIIARRGCEQRRTLGDFVTLGVHGIASSIAHANMKANNFELKPALISMVQQQLRFGGTRWKTLTYTSRSF